MAVGEFDEFFAQRENLLRSSTIIVQRGINWITVINVVAFEKKKKNITWARNAKTIEEQWRS